MDGSTLQWPRTTHYSLFTTYCFQRTLKSKLAIDLEITFSWI
jgi:hypothetical protein